ncbi:MAG: LOG family protein [Chloroflexota bacterium]
MSPSGSLPLPAKTISVFGSASPQPGSPAYAEAQELGRLLAEAGYGVATGGYSGTMAAASQGTAEAGGHVIGVTSDQIEQYRPIAPNQWVTEEIRYPTLRERLVHLVDHNDGMVALPGGVGTLSEVALAWSWLQVGEISPRPLVLLGSIWRKVIQTYAAEGYIPMRDMDLIHFAASAETAVAYLQMTFEMP